VFSKSTQNRAAKSARRGLRLLRKPLFFSLLSLISLFASSIVGQEPPSEWQAQVRKYCEAQDWPSAMHVVDREIARAPQDLDIRAWRARILAWSGHLPEAEQEYLRILKATPNDPDNWMGLGSVYLREEKIEDALRAFNAALALDPKRADVHAARARALRAARQLDEARLEFQRALSLDPGSAEARAGLSSLRGEPKHELRLGQDDDVFNFADANRDAWLKLVSQWNSHWATSFAGSSFERGGVEAGKFTGSLTGRLAKWGALTAGGAIGHDNAVIPRSEGFFDLDHEWKTGESSFVHAVEFDYGQHWYWYQTSRILTLSGTSILYLPREWTLSFGATGARSAFSGTTAEWRPSGMGRLGFPLVGRKEKWLSGNLFFAAGTEDFALVDQIGRFASQTYGGGLRFQLTARQDVTGYGGYQKRSMDRTDTSFGFSYGIRF